MVEWTKDYWIDRYPSDPRMPFEVERIHFTKTGVYHTEGKFLHIVTLTVGGKVNVRSRQHPERAAALRKWEVGAHPGLPGRI